MPSWAQTGRYDVEAQGSAGASRADTVQMLRSLLAERFGLRVHYEDRKKRAVALTLIKEQPNSALESAGIDCEQADAGAPELPPTPTGRMKPCQWLNSGSIINSGGMTMEKLAQLYAVISTALREQLGLGLERVQTALKVLVIDQIERPTPN